MAALESEDDVRRVLVSGWTIPVFLIFAIMAIMGIGQIIEGYSLALVLIGWAITVMICITAVLQLSAMIIILDSEGFRKAGRRRVPWTSVQWSRSGEVPAWIFSNYAIVITSKEKDREGRYKVYTLGGLSAFSETRALLRRSDEINDWIAQANPGEVINPWLRQTSRPDNR